MKNAFVFDTNDIKRILAEHFDVPETNVFKAQYSYVVVIEKEEEDGEANG